MYIDELKHLVKEDMGEIYRFVSGNATALDGSMWELQLSLFGVELTIRFRIHKESIGLEFTKYNSSYLTIYQPKVHDRDFWYRVYEVLRDDGNLLYLAGSIPTQGLIGESIKDISLAESIKQSL